MSTKRIGITFIGDSIMKYKSNSPNTSWLLRIKKKLKNNFKKRISLNSKNITGLNTRGLLNIISNYFLKIKFKDILIIQIGINDSWHYKSLNGEPEVSLESFKKNLYEIFKKSKLFGFKKIIFVGYHELLNNRIEINKKTINQNLQKYVLSLKEFSIKKKIKFIDINLKKKRSKNYCLKMPDGIHLNNRGAKFYSKYIYNYIYKILDEKNI